MRDGGRRDALLFSLRHVAGDELYRTRTDKRRAVDLVLADAEWSTWGDAEIANLLSVSPAFVTRMRRRGDSEPAQQGAGQGKRPRGRSRPAAASGQQRSELGVGPGRGEAASLPSAERCLVIDPYLASPEVIAGAIRLLKGYYRHKTGEPYSDSE